MWPTSLRSQSCATSGHPALRVTWQVRGSPWVPVANGNGGQWSCRGVSPLIPFMHAANALVRRSDGRSPPRPPRVVFVLGVVFLAKTGPGCRNLRSKTYVSRLQNFAASASSKHTFSGYPHKMPGKASFIDLKLKLHLFSSVRLCDALIVKSWQCFLITNITYFGCVIYLLLLVFIYSVVPEQQLSSHSLHCL